MVAVDAFYAIEKLSNHDIIGYVRSIAINQYSFSATGQTVLHHAYNRSKATAMMLVRRCGFNPNVVDSNGDSILIVAIRRGDFIMVKFLLNNGANPNSWTRGGDSALELSLQPGDEFRRITQELLIHNVHPYVVLNNDIVFVNRYDYYSFNDFDYDDEYYYDEQSDMDDDDDGDII